jgi:hypothetical protein
MNDLMTMDNQNIRKNAAQDHNIAFTEDIMIDIFSESMTEYLQKLNKASAGRYELDDYDLQVLAIALEQFAVCMR